MSEEQQNNKPGESHTSGAIALGILSGILFTIMLFLGILSVMFKSNFDALIVFSAPTGFYIYYLLHNNKKRVLRVFIMTVLILLSICGGCTAFFLRR